jgi:hypothetical protein
LAIDVAHINEDATVVYEVDRLVSAIKVFRCSVLNRNDHISIKEAYFLKGNEEKSNTAQSIREIINNVVDCFEEVSKGVSKGGTKKDECN